MTVWILCHGNPELAIEKHGRFYCFGCGARVRVVTP